MSQSWEGWTQDAAGNWTQTGAADAQAQSAEGWTQDAQGNWTQTAQGWTQDAQGNWTQTGAAAAWSATSTPAASTWTEQQQPEQWSGGWGAYTDGSSYNGTAQAAAQPE